MLLRYCDLRSVKWSPTNQNSVIATRDLAYARFPAVAMLACFHFRFWFVTFTICVFCDWLNVFSISKTTVLFEAFLLLHSSLVLFSLFSRVTLPVAPISNSTKQDLHAHNPELSTCTRMGEELHNINEYASRQPKESITKISQSECVNWGQYFLKFCSSFSVNISWVLLSRCSPFHCQDPGLIFSDLPSVRPSWKVNKIYIFCLRISQKMPKRSANCYFF